MQHGQPGGADRDVGLPVAPGPAHGVGDDDADGDAEPLPQARTAAPRRWRRGPPAAARAPWTPTLEPSTPAAACTRPSAFSVISVRPLRASTRTASASISLRRRASRSSGSDGRVDDAALALGHHLAGDHHDVVVAQPRCRRGDGRGEVVAGTELGKPGHREHSTAAAGAVLRHGFTPARSSPARTISAVVAGIRHQQRHRPHLDARRSRRGRPRAPASRPGCRRRDRAP